MGYPKLTPIVATGATKPRYLGDRFADMVNVRDYGATGDGTTDDAAAFKAAVSAAGEAAVFVPRGKYYLSEDVAGQFYADCGASFAGSGTVAFCESFTGLKFSPRDLVPHGLSIGKIPGTYEKINGSYIMQPAIIQSATYDKFDDVLYVANNFHEGSFIYAIKWSDVQSEREILGTNFISYDDTEGATQPESQFYNAFGHQNITLYRPRKEDPVMFFSAAHDYTSNTTQDSSLKYYGRITKWDYSNPSTFTVERTFKLFDSATYSCGMNQFMPSFDGRYAFAKAQKNSDSSWVIGIWKMDELLALSGTDATGIATYVDVPIGLSSQAMVSDGRLIYQMYSGTGRTCHYVSAIDFKGNVVLQRKESAEGYNGYELTGETANRLVTNLEAETLTFMPVNGRWSLVLGVGFGINTFAQDDYKKFFYFFDLATQDPQEKSEELCILKQYTSSDFTTSQHIDPFVKGTIFCNSGSCADLSGGQWIFQNLGDVKAGLHGKQIGFRLNSNHSVIYRSFNETNFSYYDYSMFAFCEPVTYNDAIRCIFTTHGQNLGNEKDHTNNYNIAVSTQIRMLAYRDTDGQSCSYISRLRRNKSQGDEDCYSYLIFEDFENSVRNPFLLMYTSHNSGGSVKDFYLIPHAAVAGHNYLGSAISPWENTYSASGAWTGSDERIKTNIEDVNESLMRAWGKVRFKVFQMVDAVGRKGNNARLHIGVIAQQVRDAFASEGLDASRYGLFCYDSWEDEWEEEEVVDVEAVLDEEGNVITPAQTHTVRKQVQTAGDRYGIRYTEALALECAYQRWRLEQLEERVNQLTNNSNK